MVVVMGNNAVQLEYIFPVAANEWSFLMNTKAQR